MARFNILNERLTLIQLVSKKLLGPTLTLSGVSNPLRIILDNLNLLDRPRLEGSYALSLTE